jgi:hypothetical protein
MFKLMRIGHTFKAPHGIVLGGINPELDSATAPVLSKALENVKTVCFLDKSGVNQKTNVIGVNVSTSIGEKLNIHLLISNHDLPDIEEGSVIYCEDIRELHDLVSLATR